MSAPPAESVDLAVVGAGAAGLMAVITAGRRAKAFGLAPRFVALDGARTLGVKILVAGGGRCNVTHHEVDESAYAGASRHAIRNVLRRFDVPATIEFFRELGVELKREDTGKLFPTTDRARTVLNALLRAADDARVEVRFPWRVATITHDPDRERPFLISREDGAAALRARRVILATGGKSLPKSGSDGAGYALARALGHTITKRVFPALVPLTLPRNHPLCALSGVSFPATLTVHAPTGKRLAAFTNSTLCAHFGLTGPAVLDVSRYYTDARLDDSAAHLTLCALPEETSATIDRALQSLASRSVASLLRRKLPARVIDTLCALADAPPDTPGHALTRTQRRRLAVALTELPLPVTGDRGWTHAEVTAGGVPLAELHLKTLESRATPGLHVIGEICDVDGRIGGFNFQWAWASGYVAGAAAAEGVHPLVISPDAR